MDQSQLFMVFDVESIGLHGEGFAVGWVVIDRQGEVQDSHLVACDPEHARGSDDGRDWVRENVKIDGLHYMLKRPEVVRGMFWIVWKHWRERGAILVADCAWPVEARFLAACVDDDPAARTWQGPYPLHDLASIRLAAGFDPLATCDRLPDELPAHDPLADARQSARLLVETLAVLDTVFQKRA